MSSQFQIESLLAARLFLTPQLLGKRIYFLSDLSGRMSLYAMDLGGSLPDALLPPNVALQNPHLMRRGELFHVLPRLNKILVMVDQDGDENYQPMMIPMDGGIPQPFFGTRFAGQQVVCAHCSPEHNLALFVADRRTEPLYDAYLVDLAGGEISELGTSAYGNFFMAADEQVSRLVLADIYTMGDVVLYWWQRGDAQRKLLYGVPLEERPKNAPPQINGIGHGEFTLSGGLLCTASLFSDTYGLVYLNPGQPDTPQPVSVGGTVHQGVGEMTRLARAWGDRYTLTYNIDGCSWVYEGTFAEEALCFTAERILCGQGELANGVLEAIHCDRESRHYALSFSTATSPSQLFVIEPDGHVAQQTRERVLGIPQEYLAPGEDASYVSHDGQRVSARLYMPAPALGFQGRRPVLFYIHGGPQGQERPDFTWFSMPLIQYLTLNGFAVFVPNVRGSSGYGMNYMKEIDRDWGGQDRLDHVAAFGKLRRDPRLDMERAGVMGRSYGGFMTLTLVGRHPELFRAACDLFGPYDLFTFLERLPGTWQNYFYLALGHPERDADFLQERSPSSHIHRLACPLLVIQGANDPRVVEQESTDLVEGLQRQGKVVEYLVFPDEGHDVIKFQNKATCYRRMADFFASHLGGA